MSRPTHGAGASAAALAMCAMDPDDTEGAEPQPVDAEEKNMAGDGKKRRVERTHDPSRHTHDTEAGDRRNIHIVRALTRPRMPPLPACLTHLARP